MLVCRYAIMIRKNKQKRKGQAFFINYIASIIFNVSSWSMKKVHIYPCLLTDLTRSFSCNTPQFRKMQKIVRELEKINHYKLSRKMCKKLLKKSFWRTKIPAEKFPFSTYVFTKFTNLFIFTPFLFWKWNQNIFEQKNTCPFL